MSLTRALEETAVWGDSEGVAACDRRQGEMETVYLGTKRRRRMLEWLVVGPLAAGVLAGIVEQTRRYPQPAAVWVTVPLQADGSAVCPKDQPFEVSVSDDAVMCSSAEVR